LVVILFLTALSRSSRSGYCYEVWGLRSQFRQVAAVALPPKLPLLAFYNIRRSPLCLAAWVSRLLGPSKGPGVFPCFRVIGTFYLKFGKACSHRPPPLFFIFCGILSHSHCSPTQAESSISLLPPLPLRSPSASSSDDPS